METFRQKKEDKTNFRNKSIYVSQDKYVIETKENVEEIRTVLGTCTSLIGVKKDKGIFFLTHNMLSNKTKELIDSLRMDLLKDFQLEIEDFDLYISGGKKSKYLGSKEKITIGEKNANSILENINKKPIPIHLNKDKGNSVKLNLHKNTIIAKALN